MIRRSKKYLEATKLVDPDQVYTPQQAIELVQKAHYTRFDESVELHLRMGVDSRNSEQQVRGVASLPHGLGKKVRVLVFAQGEAVGAAREAGADEVGGDELIKRIEEGFIDFDVALGTPDMMGRVGKLGRILGRRGLMPNPKAGTVVQPTDLPRAIKDAKQGRVEFRLDKTAIIHMPVGKVSFDKERLLENLASAMEAVVKARPSGAKGQFVRSAYICSTMGPSVKLDLKSTLSLASESSV